MNTPASVQPASVEQLQDFILARLGESLSIDPEEFDLMEPFGSYGLSSVQALVLVGKLEKRVGFALSPTLLWNYPTIESLATWLSSELQTRNATVIPQEN